MKKKIQRHKRHFQLLELMVAVFILLICIVPTMRIFTSMYQSQQGIIRENQSDHLAHMAHAKFTEMLYKRQIAFEDVMQSKTILMADPELTCFMKKSLYSCEGMFTIINSYTPKGQDHPTKYLGKLVIKIKDLALSPVKKKIQNQDPAERFYDYFIYIDAGAKDSKDNSGEKKKEDKKSSDEDSSDEKNPLIPKPADKDAKTGSS